MQVTKFLFVKGQAEAKSIAEEESCIEYQRDSSFVAFKGRAVFEG